MKPVIVFDVNETLLDMLPLRDKVNALLQQEHGFKVWFGLMLQYSLVENVMENYHPFPEIGNATLDMAATSFGLTITAHQKKEALALITQLPAYPDVKNGLAMLKDAGFRLITLTNSPDETLQKQLNHAGLANFFELCLSIHTVKKYKPAGETYAYAANQAGVNPNEMLMVAAHGWDIAGAQKAGLQTAFVAREGKGLYSLAPKANYTGKDIIEVARQICASFEG